MNHVHLWSMLPGTDENDYPELWDLGEVIRGAWRNSLACAFPDRMFEVTLNDDYGPTVSAVTAPRDAP